MRMGYKRGREGKNAVLVDREICIDPRSMNWKGSKEQCHLAVALSIP